MTTELTKLSWMTDDEFEDLVIARKKFSEWNFEFAYHPMMRSFTRDKSILLVFNSSRLESTLPIGLKYSNTYKMLKDVSLDSPASITAWNFDGKRGNEKCSLSGAARQCQLIQHLKAYKYMMSLKKLTLEGILKSHDILMLGAVSDDGSPILNGKFRTFGVNNGVDNYMSYELAEENMEKVVEWYNNFDGADSVEVAYKLFWKFLKIHPFEDGNGRIARLLVANHMCSLGTPFPVCVTSGKRRSRKHYYDAIKREDLLYCSRTGPYTLIAQSVYLRWKNFLNLKNSVEIF